MDKQNQSTLEKIHTAAKKEFFLKGFEKASLRNIVKSLGITTGAFYGYYNSKEELFEAIVKEHYEYILNRFIESHEEFAALPHEKQPENMGKISLLAMHDMLNYSYAHTDEMKLILCSAKGTKYANLVDEMVNLEIESTHNYQKVLCELNRPSPKIDPILEHILTTGMINAFFELVIHEIPIERAKNYLEEMWDFYTAGWMKIMGQ